MKLRKILVLAGVAILLVNFALVAQTTGTECPEVINVEVAKVAGQSFPAYSQFQARIRPEIIVIKTQVPGKLVDIKVAEGDLVSQGLEMVVIDEGLASAIKVLEAEVKRWEANLAVRKGWKTRDPKAEAQAIDKIKEAQKAVEEKKAAAAGYVIKSPVDGKVKGIKVTSINVSQESGMITEKEVIVEIENSQVMLAEIAVPAEEKGTFIEGKEYPVSFAELGDKYTAIARGVTETTLVLAIENKQKLLKEGFSLKFEMLKDYLVENQVVIPVKWISKDEQGPFIYKMSGDYARKTYLNLGPIREKKILVLEGLLLDDEVIISEILSPGQGLLKETLECVKDNGQVQVMVKKYFKRKASKKGVEEVAGIEVKEEGLPNVFKMALGGGFFDVSDTMWTDVYKKMNPLFGLRLAYEIKQRFEIFAEADMMAATGELFPTLIETKFSATPIYLGIRYIFMPEKKVTPYLGAAGIMASVREKTDVETIKDNAFGASIQVGGYFNLGQKLALDLQARYDILSFQIEEFNEKVKLSGLRLMLFLTYKF